MALYHNMGGRYAPISWCRKYEGKDVILCGTGPSLWEIEPSLLHSTQKLIFGLNNSFELIPLDMWMGWDPPDHFSNKLWESDSVKLYNWEHRHDLEDKNVSNLFLYAGYRLNEDEGEKFDENLVVSGPLINFIFEGCTFPIALHMLHWLGFKRVFLVGCDFGGESVLSKKSRGYRELGQEENLSKGLSSLSDAHLNSSVEFISCTPHSPINDFLEYQDIKTLSLESV